MQKSLYFLLLLFICSCGAKKRTAQSKNSVKRSVSVKGSKPESSKASNKELKKTKLTVADNIINTALSFSGTRYKYGGTTKKGMDCSGLLYVSFRKHNVPIPRVSYVMANEGKRIKINKVEKGDLLFFKTKKRGKRINHVGMVVSTKGNEVKFIHSSSSRGVIISSMRETYWNSTFIKATRIL